MKLGCRLVAINAPGNYFDLLSDIGQHESRSAVNTTCRSPSGCLSDLAQCPARQCQATRYSTYLANLPLRVTTEIRISTDITAEWWKRYPKSRELLCEGSAIDGCQVYEPTKVAVRLAIARNRWPLRRQTVAGCSSRLLSLPHRFCFRAVHWLRHPCLRLLLLQRATFIRSRLGNQLRRSSGRSSFRMSICARSSRSRW